MLFKDIILYFIYNLSLSDGKQNIFVKTILEKISRQILKLAGKENVPRLISLFG